MEFYLDTTKYKDRIHTISLYATDSAGNLIAGDQLKELPIGSTLDTQRGIFYWQPGPGFLGEYRFLFMMEDQDGITTRKEIEISIMAKL